MGGRHDLTAAVERLRRHFAATNDGADPYRDNPEHLWDADQYRWDSEAVIRDYLSRHGGPEPGTGRNTEGI